MNLRQQILALATIPLILAILLITTIVVYQSTSLARSSIETFEANMLKAKERELLNLTNLAVSAISETYNRSTADDFKSKEVVKNILMNLNYGIDGYFFAYDYDGNNIVHPRQLFRLGRNWLELEDADGDRVIANLIAQAKKGGGLHQYKWEKPSTGIVADKLSFAVGLDKWQWMLGTGVYLDDVYAQTQAATNEFRRSINRTFFFVTIITVPAVVSVFLVGIFLNLRERRLADEKLKELTQRIIDTQEEERLRIARELHDGISQNLVGIRYAFDLAMKKTAMSSEDALPAIERGVAELNNAIKEVRRISHDLRPGLLDDLGLTAALESLTNNFSERTGISVSMHSVAFKNIMIPEARTALYRVAQEALNNIERHANASEVNITLTSARSYMQMLISDNGTGFRNNIPGTSNIKPGLGLRNMQERLAHFGGTLEVETSSSGTTLRARLPKSIYITRREEKTVSEPT